MTAVVTETITVGSTVDGVPGPISVRLAYEPNDPYAVHMFFIEGNAEPVEWQIGRDLFVSGMKAPAGECGAHVWPGAHSRLRPPKVLMVLLSSPDGRMEVVFPYAWVKDFLHRTFDVVPAGAESEHIDIDRAIALLREDA